MCPVWWLHPLIYYILLLLPVWVACRQAPKLNGTFEPENLPIFMDETKNVTFEVSDLSKYNEGDMLQICAYDDYVANAEYSYILSQNDLSKGWKGSFNITGNFLGKTEVIAHVIQSDSVIQRRSYETKEVSRKCPENTDGHPSMEVVVTRKMRIIDHVFVGSVATLVSLIYINFGCALDWDTVKATIKRPIGPAIGFCGQFIFMPLISYCLGLVLFPNNIPLQLGMFFTGVSPGGGASNIWTYVLGGNLNLSITMTTISTLAAFGMMPLWLFTLGRLIFNSGNMKVPYSRIASVAVGLVIPLGIGLLIQKYFPRVSNFMVRILKGFSSLLLLFIIVFATVTNIYLFQLFSWQIVVAGMGVPWLGYCMAWILAKSLKQSPPDCLAIAIETGIQNTGISIFLLNVSLPQPEADLTAVIPVAVAIMTPLPMILLYLYQTIMKKWTINKDSKLCEKERDPLPISQTQESIVNLEARF